ncbi:thioether cross-link-forming SCIFF peptide maturase [Ructibacterium gallinarum]|uniref:Thioether cross-link-forming SCIFF peptide maturase n=1 Tax=Ructibacterium gallinarum TaxID=2779355 RepID=A0A9D5RBV4_9FIRM|nr:thioether cross-link-forming SCIFF peptide maturase [Ructibacterium gallinarum]MBE5040393.1 thioether cross-link-forming SCIFF peptide maturase [Ructibacterium gallinarum]
MVHAFQMKDKYIALDVNSGCVHVLDKLCYDIICFLCDHDLLPEPEVFEKTVDQLGKIYQRDALQEGWDEIKELYANGVLFSADEYADIAVNMKRHSPVKAMCLHVAHDCNLRCAYCFADEGAYHNRRELMSAETGKQAMDFLIQHSGNRRNLEVDFFGGEPLMNFDVVKEVVEYAREQEKIHNKNFRFTITTNGVLLNDENLAFINKNMSNVVLSLDGRKEVNDRVRCKVDGSGSYDSIVPKLIKVAESRHQDNYYVRGTFTKYNLDFSKDVLHLADLGFKQTSVEPVVSEPGAPYAITEEDLPKLFEEYEKLVEAYLQRKKEGRGFNFFHFMIDLEQGPCVIKRLSGCGAGCEYLAVAPNGDIYPCHQFVGTEKYKMGNIAQDTLNQELRGMFEECNVYTKPKCRECFAKFYCSGGCMANACLLNGDINEPHEISCKLQRKRVECSLYAKAVEAELGL